jgi:hypothetical protein
MRTFSSGQISVSIAVLVAAFIVGTLVVPEGAIAREPEYEIVSSIDGGGGAGGGGEWRTDPFNGGGLGLPVDDGKAPGPGHRFTEGSYAGAEASWAERVEAWYLRLLKAVSSVFVQKYL